MSIGMTDQGLADWIVTNVSGHAYERDGVVVYALPNWASEKPAEQFVLDWRVAGAMLEAAKDAGKLAAVFATMMTIDDTWDPLADPRAINEACAEDLT